MATIAVAVMCLASPLAADTCVIKSGGPFTWNDPAAWTCTFTSTGSSWPGEKGNDTAAISSAETVNVAAPTPFPVTLDLSSSGAVLNVNSSGVLTVDPVSSVILAGNSINVSGGTLIVDSGGVLEPRGPLVLNSGTLTMIGGIDIIVGSFAFNGGTLNGPGVLTLHGGTTPLTGSNGSMLIVGARIDNLGVLDFTSSRFLGLFSGARIRNVTAESSLHLHGTGSIDSDSTSTSIDLLPGTSLEAYGDPSVVSVALNNEGLVISYGYLALIRGGTHFGEFYAATPGATMLFSGIHNFGGGTTFTEGAGAPAFIFDGAASQFNFNQNFQSIAGLQWSGGTIGGDGQTLTLSGTNLFDALYGRPLVIAAGTTIHLPGSQTASLTLGTSTNIAGPGALELGPRTAVTFNGSPNVISAPVMIASPTFAFGFSGQITFSGGGTISSGTFDTTDLTQTFRFGGPFLVHGGTFSGPGAVCIDPGGTFAIDGMNTTVAFAGTPGSARLFNAGRITFGPPAMSVDFSGFNIRNDPTGVIDLQNDVSLTASSAPATILNNGGTFKKSGGTWTSSIQQAFTNGGTVIAATGTLDFVNGYTQSGGATTLAGGTLAINGGAGTFNLGSGYLNGTGTLQASLANIPGGIVEPGFTSPLSPGMISVTGNYSQTGALQIRLGGTAPGSGYSRLNVGGAASIGGGLGVTLIPPYTSPSGQAYDIVTSGGARNGAFAITYFPAPTSPWSTAYLPNGVQIAMQQADLSITQSAPASVVHGNDIVYTISITNHDPTMTASNLSITNTPSGPATIKSTSASTCTTFPPQTLMCDAGPLAPGATYSMTLTLATTGTGSVLNSASVVSTPFDPNLMNNSMDATVAVTPAVNAGVTVTDSPDPVLAGKDVTYTVTITNGGIDASAGGDSLGLALTGGTIKSLSGLSCPTTTGTSATCTLPSIPAGGSASMTVVATADTGTSMSLQGTAAVANDTNAANDVGAAATMISPAADLAVSQSVAPATLLASESAIITVTVTNNGPSPATNITLTDSLTGPATIKSATSPFGTCSLTGQSVACPITALGSGTSASIVIDVLSTGAGSIVSSPSVPAAAPPLAQADPVTGNNAGAPASITVAPSADLALSVTASPNPVAAGVNTTLNATITNLGPSDATNVTFTDSFTYATLVSVQPTQGTCSGTTTINCALGTLHSGGMATVAIVLHSGMNSIQNNASVSSAEPDLTGSNNSSALTVQTNRADISVSKSGPESAVPGAVITYTITIANQGPSTAAGIEVSDPAPAGTTPLAISGACSVLPCTIPTLYPGSSAVISTSCSVASGANPPKEITNTATAHAINDPNPSNDSASVTTVILCATEPPTLISPPAGATVSSPVTFTWTAVPNAVSYEVFVTQSATVSLGTTSGTSLAGSVPSGPFSWYVVATTSDCGPLTSASISLNACNPPDAPVASVVANAASGQSYALEWTDVSGANGWEIQESANADFAGAATTSSIVRSVTFTHTTTDAAQPFFYRVRAVASCDPRQKGSWSDVIRVVIAPIPVQNTNPNANVPAGSNTVVIVDVPIAGIDDGNSYIFNAMMDKPWMSVAPASGVLPPAGIVLQVSGDPSSLSNGTFTGTLIVTISPAAIALSRGAATSSISVPVSINLVTPVTPTKPEPTASNALVIPSVGHLDGVNSQWQSDVRIANPGTTQQQYVLTFTPSSNQSGLATTGVKQTTVTIDPGTTVAFDDIARNWFGVGSLGEAANGVLMIKPLDTTPGLSKVVASSRTYSVSSAGTLGQYIPAIPFSSFVGTPLRDQLPTILGLQHIAQSNAFRTNLGLVEAGGASASLNVRVFDAAGKNILQVPLTIAAFQQMQLNSFLASQGVTLEDGRIEVEVTGGDGRITAYASLVDNLTNDSLLVSGVSAAEMLANRYVLPGIADINQWRSDVHIFNAGLTPHTATLTLYPLGGGTPLSATVTVDPGEVERVDNAIQSLFGMTSVGGALHVTTDDDSSLLVSGRTYNAVNGGGTYGQFIPAVTGDDAVGAGERTLQILQVEDSPRYRTNLGIAEVNGQTATVEISVYLPGSKVTPLVRIPLQPYEYQQFAIIQQLGLGNVYNARISVRVVDGSGRITAYGSVIDQQTQDPTYVPAQ